MQGLESLPPWAQVVLSILAFLAAATAWVRGMFKNLPEKSKDVVVPSVTVADGQVIDRLTETLRETNRLMQTLSDRDARMEVELRRLSDQGIEDRVHLKSIEALLSKLV